MEERKIGLEIRTLNNMIKRRIHAYGAKQGADECTMMHSWIIRFVFENGDRDVFQKDIEQKYSISRSTATGILQLMEKKGYLTRVPVAHDGRLKKLVLTERAIKLHLGMVEELEEMEKRLALGISDQELDCFFDVVRKMKSNLREDKLC